MHFGGSALVHAEARRRGGRMVVHDSTRARSQRRSTIGGSALVHAEARRRGGRMVAHDSTRARSQRRGTEVDMGRAFTITAEISSRSLTQCLLRDLRGSARAPTIRHRWRRSTIGGSALVHAEARRRGGRMVVHDSTRPLSLRRGTEVDLERGIPDCGRDLIQVSHPVPPPWPPRLRARTPNAPQVIGGAGAQSVAARWFTRRREDAEGGWSTTIRREPARSAGAPKWIWSEAFPIAAVISSRSLTQCLLRGLRGSARAPPMHHRSSVAPEHNRWQRVGSRGGAKTRRADGRSRFDATPPAVSGHRSGSGARPSRKLTRCHRGFPPWPPWPPRLRASNPG